MASPEDVEQTIKSLERIQDFDAETLSRVEELGKQLSFEKAVPHAKRLISLYRKIPSTILAELPTSWLTKIRNRANGDLNLLNEVLKFSTAQDNVSGQRTQLMDKINRAYDESFEELSQAISYSVAQVTDTAALEAKVRSAIQDITDQTEAVLSGMQAQKTEGETILQDIRKVAAEQGVSQQAIYFQGEAQAHNTDATTWAETLRNLAIAIVVFAIATMFVHKWTWLAPTSIHETIQLVSSKLLIFFVLGYLLVLAARNYLSHKHNEVVNKHRQNALLTYRSLADASQNKGTEDVILAHAAACIFSPQETGYTKVGAESSGGSRSILELLTKSPKADSQ